MSILSRKVVWGLVAGVAVGGFAIAQPPTDPVRAADPLGAMLSEAKAAYSKVRDYACTFTRQERVNGVLGAEQVASLKVRTKPYSVAVRYARPEAVSGQEAVFVETARLGKVKYRTGGPKAGGPLLLLPDDPKLVADTRHPPTEIGVGPTIDRLVRVVNREKTLGNAVEVYAADFQFAGRNATRYELFTRRPHAHRYAYRTLVYVDKETKLPVRFEAYDAPKPGTTVGELLEAYSYTDMRVNVGVGDSAFE